MRFLKVLTSIVVFAVFLADPAAAQSREEQRVSDAADVLDQFLRIPEQRKVDDPA